MRLRDGRWLWLSWIGLFVSAVAGAAETAELQGRVVTPDGRPAVDATVRITPLGRQVPVGPDGTFRLTGLPPGPYFLEASSPRWGRAVRQVTLQADETQTVEVLVTWDVPKAEVVVTAAPRPRLERDVYPPTRVLAGPELDIRRQASLGETLAREVGVHSTYFGPAASQPVVRGFSGERVLVLEDGLGTGDLYAITPDSAVSVEPLALDRVEIVRGPATLLYGGGAIGGVVQVMGTGAPTFLPERPLHGSLRLTGDTGAFQRAGALDLFGRAGTRWVWSVDLLKRVTDDYAVPGGELRNSAVDSQQGALGITHLTDSVAVGLSALGLRSDYGVPGTRDRIEMERVRLNFRFETLRPWGITESLRVWAAYTDYRHREAEEEEEEEEADEGGTRFTRQGWQARVEWNHRSLGPLTGTLGVQAARDRLETTGREGFLPHAETRQWAAFLWEEVPVTPSVRLQFGLRYEHQTAEEREDGVRRTFGGLSASMGGLLRLPSELTLAVWVARNVRPPTVEELLAEGPDPPARVFLVGRPDLTREASTSVDVSLRRTEGRLRAELNGFVYWFSNYVYAAPTGLVEESFPVVQFTQGPARFVGGEARVGWDLWRTPGTAWTLQGWVDTVRAELRPTGEPIPRTPPLRFGTRLDYRGRRAWGTLEVFRVADQRRVAPNETPTPGYTMVHAAVGYRFFQGRVVHDVLLRGSNLLNVTARNHLSFLKDVAPLPGRSLSLTYQLTF